MTDEKKSRVVGFNHVALEVGDIDQALGFYGSFLDFELRSKSDNMAFIDLGDQFLALSKGRRQTPDDDRHFGLVVEDKAAVAKPRFSAIADICKPATQPSSCCSRPPISFGVIASPVDSLRRARASSGRKRNSATPSSCNSPLAR